MDYLFCFDVRDKAFNRRMKPAGEQQVKEHFSPREIDSHDYVVMSNALQRPNCAT
ncbi:hypothetical protein Tcan_06631 [Toxocara canis]|uniref:Uncharacterized protein n=1 Tax=Toxocara canis TaxID=6265 RepID=A0A0B2UYI3_TOXCA|nr:hypothetical protein Tcan_06631 [Toxocara canis]